jgi:nitric oxide reductase large subunit
VLFEALVVVVVGSLAGEMLSYRGAIESPSTAWCFYGVGMLFGPKSHFAVIDFWRFWILPLVYLAARMVANRNRAGTVPALEAVEPLADAR